MEEKDEFNGSWHCFDAGGGEFVVCFLVFNSYVGVALDLIVKVLFIVDDWRCIYIYNI